MGYSDGYVERQAGIGLGGKIAIALALLIGLPIVLAFGYGIYSTVMVSRETKLERAMANAPEAKGFFAGLKLHYPQEYAALNASALQLAERDRALEGVMLILRKANEFQHSHATEAANAPDQLLSAVLNNQIKVSAFVVHKPEFCKRGLSGNPGQLPAMSADEMRKLEANQLGFVAAAAAGRDHPVKRPALYYSDQQTLFGKLGQRGVAVAELSELNRPGASDAASLRKCMVALELLRAVAALPPAQSMRIFAQLVRTS